VATERQQVAAELIRRELEDREQAKESQAGKTIELLSKGLTKQARQQDESTRAQVDQILLGIETIAKEMGKASRDQDKRFEKQAKAHTNALSLSTKQLKEVGDSNLNAVVDQLSVIAQANPALIKSLIAALKDSLNNAPEQKPVKFDIERDQRGYLKSVIATPIRS